MDSVWTYSVRLLMELKKFLTSNIPYSTVPISQKNAKETKFLATYRFSQWLKRMKTLCFYYNILLTLYFYHVQPIIPKCIVYHSSTNTRGSQAVPLKTHSRVAIVIHVVKARYLNRCTIRHLANGCGSGEFHGLVLFQVMKLLRLS